MPANDAVLNPSLAGRRHQLGVGRYTRLTGLVAAAVTLALAPACASVKSTYHLAIAEKGLKRATEAGGEEDVPYYWTLASRYLEKSREEAASSDHKHSVQLSKKSAEFADQVLIELEKKGTSQDVDRLQRQLRERPVEAAPTAPPAETDPTAPTVEGPINLEDVLGGTPVDKPPAPPPPPPPPADDTLRDADFLDPEEESP